MDPGRHKDPEKDVWAPGWLLAQEKRVEGTYKSYQSKQAYAMDNCAPFSRLFYPLRRFRCLPAKSPAFALLIWAMVEEKTESPSGRLS